jgi:hypothetical protein
VIEHGVNLLLRQVMQLSPGGGAEATTKAWRDLGVYHHRELGDVGRGADFAEAGRDLPDHVMYFIRPSLHESKTVGREIAAAIKKGVRSQFHVYFVPSRSVVCEQIFEDEGALQHTTFSEFNLGLVPLDADVLSLEMPSVFRECELDGDTSSLSSVARALTKLQHSLGIFRGVRSKGAASKQVLQMMMHLRREEEIALPGTS